VDLLDDIKETYDNLHKYKMMLNSKKYVFDVSSEKLLGYIVSSQRIDANLKKVKAIKNLQPPQTRKEIQKLAGMMADSVDSYPSWTNVVCLSISYYGKEMDFSGMIKRQRLSLSSSNT
jgi:hypothetical protein